MFRLLALAALLVPCAAFAQEPSESTEDRVPELRNGLADESVMERRLRSLEREIVKSRMKSEDNRRLEYKIMELEARLDNIERKYFIYEDEYEYPWQRYRSHDRKSRIPALRFWDEIEEEMDEEDEEDDEEDYHRWRMRSGPYYGPR